MSLIAFVAPILPGKRDQWDAFMADLSGPRHSEFNASRQRHGIHERNFLQTTPMGDLVIVTLEGDNPLEALGAIVNSDDAFTNWFVQQVQEIHGFNLRQPPEHPPHIILDSETPTTT